MTPPTTLNPGPYHVTATIVNKAGILVYKGGIDNDPDGDKSDRVNYVQKALDELLGEQAGLAGRHEHEQRVRIGIAGALQERRGVGIGEL